MPFSSLTFANIMRLIYQFLLTWEDKKKKAFDWKHISLPITFTKEIYFVLTLNLDQADL